ncbi:MAG: DUF1080 domain-containing protein [Acidobacteria bacterium]|nr:DUF1080 domain-containing protein [Acidobacteriota bacterium]
MRLCLLLAFCSATLPAQEWNILFDGHNVAAWRTATGDEFPSSSWEVKDGWLQTIPSPLFAQDLWTREKYRNFELEFEWRVDAKGNSGVKYLIQAWLHGKQVNGRPVVGKPFEKMSLTELTPADGAFEYTVGSEYQLIEEESLPASMGPVQRTGALYGIFPPLRPAGTRTGEIHLSRLLVKGNHVEHWLDGQLLLAYEIGSGQWVEGMKASGRTAAKLMQTMERQTPIALQHHSSRVAFRKLRVRPLQN